MEKRWQFSQPEKGLLASLSEQLHISPVLAQVLANRGIASVEEGSRFLHDTLAALADPFLMKGMDAAVMRLEQAIKAKERIVIYGDYDVDGITSTSLLYSVLRDLGAAPHFYIPERESEGYGLNECALEELSREADLLVTVDCGISSYDLVREFADRLDIIITDHHEPPAQIPPALSVLNPKQDGCAYPYKELAGAGVAYVLCRALWQHCCGEALPGYTDLAALGTIADLVPLTGENRILVRHGLAAMKEGKRIGIKALLDASNLSGKAITAGRIAFTAAPRLNAAGRISHATKGVELLLETDPVKAAAAADELSRLNTERQDIEHTIAQEAIAQIEKQGRCRDGVLIAYGEGWHVGVIGIAASRLVETYYRPSLVITVRDGVGKGSCRSIAGFNMYEALQSAADLLIQFGGHTMAAGFSVKAENIEALRSRLLDYAAAHMTAADYVPLVHIDRQLQPSDVSLELIAELARLEPYGMGNSRPVFSLSGAVVDEIRPIGRDKQHVRLVARGADRTRLAGVAWSQAHLCDEIVEGDTVDLAFQLERNDFNGTSSPQLVIQDVHLPARRIELDRTVMVDIYIALKKCLPEWGMPVWQVRRRLAAAEGDRYDVHVIYAAIVVLREIGVLKVRQDEDGPAYYFPVLAGKMNLHMSPTYELYCKE
ncbi:MAG: single-stranded-DNA-specific exonuclease RecJ [Megasphaera sp.]|uniref:single-stranded-DNA-specific exonuclease RecJ n=1 Tax=Megasphaera sp. TaxID=2023260 RepID=UPI003F0CF819